MNEVGWDDSSSDAFIGSDTMKVQDHIQEVFVDAWRKSVNLFPKTYFEKKLFLQQPIISDLTTGTGYVILPDNFHVLYQFKMQTWQVSAEKLYDSSDSIARLQANQYTRGNICRPVCVKANRLVNVRVDDKIIPTPKDVLLYYSLPKGADQVLEEAIYIPLIEPLNDKIEISQELFIPLAYICASMVFSIYEKEPIAQILEKKATEII